MICLFIFLYFWVVATAILPKIVVITVVSISIIATSLATVLFRICMCKHDTVLRRS